jgi:hypothetical protein
MDGNTLNGQLMINVYLQKNCDIMLVMKTIFWMLIIAATLYVCQQGFEFLELL